MSFTILNGERDRGRGSLFFQVEGEISKSFWNMLGKCVALRWAPAFTNCLDRYLAFQ